MEQSQALQLIKRIVVYCFGLFIFGVGVILAVNSELGLSPVATGPYVLGRIFHVSIGTFTAILLIFYVLLQILILRRDYKWVNLVQILAAALFGVFIDLAGFLIGDFQLPTYFGRMAMQGISILLSATAITILAEVQLVMLPAEGLVAAIAQKLPNGAFHRVKVSFDCVLTTCSIALSLLFLGGLYGIREGTVLSAIFVGKLIPHARKLVIPAFQKIGIR